MDFPKPEIVTPTHINSCSTLMAGRTARAAGLFATNIVSGSWSAANLALYIPLYMPWPYYVARAFWTNGATAAGNSDIGIYALGGARIWSSGSTANSGASTVQYVTAGILLSPGWYYMGYANDGTTNRVFGSNVNVGIVRMTGILQQATALPLPNPATFAAYSQTTGVSLPLIGITRAASGF